MSQETKFAIFCLESYKVHRSLTGTTGYQYINHDIDLYLKARKAEVPG